MKRQWGMILLFAVVLGLIVVGLGSNGATAAAESGGTTTLVSVSSTSNRGNGVSWEPSLSADGSYVAFRSGATNLVPGDTNGREDVFVHDRQSGTTTRVSVSSTGEQGNNWSGAPAISADGRYVAFTSEASNLVPGDTNYSYDIFVRDRQTGTTERVSVSSSGEQGDYWSETPTISANGRYVAFSSVATNFVPGDTNDSDDIFVHDRQSGTTELVSVSSTGAQGNYWSITPAISADGRYVAFQSGASNLVPSLWVGVFIHDRQSGTTELVSVSSSGERGNNWSGGPAISADGRYVSFWSEASNLVAGDTNGSYDIFVHDRQSGRTERVSISSGGAQGNSYLGESALSADGRYVAFYASSASNLVPDDTNCKSDIFIRDRQSGTTKRVSVSSAGDQGNNWSDYPALSADGYHVAFVSAASNLVPGDVNETADIFVHDREGQRTDLYSVSGKVMTEGGAPMPGVTVRTSLGSATTTDINGDYTIPNLISGSYKITAKKEGYIINPSSKTVTVPPHATEQNFFVIPDTDGDGLPNEWETNGYYFQGAFVDLPKLGARVDHKDIFVYYDWLEGDYHSHDPEDSLSLVVQAFANAPILNPNGQPGINLHLMRGHMVPETEKYRVLGQCVDMSNYSWEEFDTIKSGFPRELWLTFHYAVFAHDIISCDGSHAGGISRNAERDRSASDFIVALGDWEIADLKLPPFLGYDIDFQRAGTFMHELGHNLGLHHGGVVLDSQGVVVGWDERNYKPNHLSVMNYFYQWTGLRKKLDFGFDTDGHMDYSRFSPFQLLTLDENHLNETKGLMASGEALNFKSRYYCPNGDTKYVDLQGSADWNCDGALNEIVAHDLTRDGTSNDILTTMNEWEYLVFDGGAIGANGDYMELPTITPETKEMTFEEAEALAPDIYSKYLPLVLR